MSSKDTNETRTMHTKSDYIEIKTCNESDEIIPRMFWFFFIEISKRLWRINERQWVCFWNH